MQFHLNFQPIKSIFQISHEQKIFLIGSCFAENIGQKLIDNKFNCLVNPNGILFNPISILNALQNAVHQNIFDINYVVERDGHYFSYLHHSKIKAKSVQQLQNLIQETNTNNHQYLKTCDYLIITFGTAFHYYHKTLNSTVANCHKQAQQTFDKKLVSVSEITDQFNFLFKELLRINSNLKIILTVSPVKHLKDGLIENNISKSTLVLSVHELCKSNKNCVYFPAFELVTDDLRDHRFYKADLAHPNDLAIEYVWEKFSETYFNSLTKKTVIEIEKLNSFLKHQILHASNQMHSKASEFIHNQKEIIQLLNPQIQF